MTTQTNALTGYARPTQWTGLPLVDTDVHINVPGLKALYPYLEPRWQDYITESGMGGLPSNLYPDGAPNLYLDGSRPESGPPGSSAELLRGQLLDPWQLDYAVLNCTYGVDSIHNDDFAAVMARAVNRWQLEEFLRSDTRLRGSAVLPLQNPEYAVAEIEWAAQFSEFVQVTVPARTREPLGRRAFWPIYQAAQDAGLVVGIQAGGMSGNPVTPVGWATYFVEDYIDVSLAFQHQLLSLVAEGVFVKFPELTVATIEGGFSWLPSLMWRFDKDWRGLRREVPWVTRPPSEYVRDHVRMTIQPLDDPATPTQLIEVIDQLLCEDMLMFSTDYPHAHFDDPLRSMPQGLPDELRPKVMAGNALATYRFE
ncbi:amidohydrolase family protein [Flindersiella endophytica]